MSAKDRDTPALPVDDKASDMASSNSLAANNVEGEKQSDEKRLKEKTSAMKKNLSDSKKTAMANTGNENMTNTTLAKKAKPSGLLMLALVIAIAAALGSAYVWQLGQQQQLRYTAELEVLKQQLSQPNKYETDLRKTFEQQQALNEAGEKQISERINVLHLMMNEQQKRLQTLATTDRGDWLLAEAEYLMKLANQRLLMGKELEGAAELLAAADDILRDFDDAALNAVRKILADEITALKFAARVDVEGLYLRLGAMAEQLNKMSLFKIAAVNTVGSIDMASEIQSEASQSVEDNWQQRIDRSYEQAKRKLGQYIQIKRREQSFKPLLVPEEEAAIRYSIQLMFEQAQLALLAGKQKLYDQSLAKSKKWVNDYFGINEAQLAEFNVLIATLEAQQVSIDLPDISASSRALKTYLETVHQLPQKNSQPNTEPANIEDINPEPEVQPLSTGSEA